MAESAHPSSMIVADFIKWNGRTDTRYELAFGLPVAMAPPAGRHVVIQRNVMRALDRQVGSPSGVYTGGGVARSKDDDEFRLPDVFVSCEPPPLLFFRQPRLLVEVLSPSTEKGDRTDKLDFYRSLQSVEAVVLVWQDRRRVQVLRCEFDRWSIQDLVGGGDLSITALDLRLTLDEIYQGIDLPPEDEPLSA